VLESAGAARFEKITQGTIKAGKDRRSDTPQAARNFLDARRGLFRSAKKAGLVKVDPTAGVGNPKCKTGDGFVAWTDEHVAAYDGTAEPRTVQSAQVDACVPRGDGQITARGDPRKDKSCKYNRLERLGAA
jgi:hypothetical protein